MGRSTTIPGLNWYYEVLTLPGLAIADWVISAVWVGIFACITLAVLIVWNCFERDTSFWGIQILFMLNILLSSQWGSLVFGSELVGLSIMQAVAVEGTGVLLMCCVARRSRLVSYLLIPYVLCGGFALYPNLIAWWVTYVRD